MTTLVLVAIPLACAAAVYLAGRWLLREVEALRAARLRLEAALKRTEERT
jgi:hypothetical protein